MIADLIFRSRSVGNPWISLRELRGKFIESFFNVDFCWDESWKSQVEFRCSIVMRRREEWTWSEVILEKEFIEISRDKNSIEGIFLVSRSISFAKWCSVSVRQWIQWKTNKIRGVESVKEIFWNFKTTKSLKNESKNDSVWKAWRSAFVHRWTSRRKSLTSSSRWNIEFSDKLVERKKFVRWNWSWKFPNVRGGARRQKSTNQMRK